MSTQPSSSATSVSYIHNLFSISQKKYGKSVFLQLAVLVAPLLFIFGCTNVASTAVALSLVHNPQPDDSAQTLMVDAVTDSTSQFAIHEPGWDVPLTATLFLPPVTNNWQHVEHESHLEALAHPANSSSTVAEAPEIGAVQPAGLPEIPAKPVKSKAGINHVVIITIDGLRPDALDIANTPTLDKLREQGAYSPSAQTIFPSFTLPSHVSMLTGVLPKEHGIVEALPCIGCRLSIGPTLFNVARDAGLTTGAVFGKEKLGGYLVSDVSVPAGSMNELFCADAHDPDVKDAAVEIIQEGLPNVFFIHFPDTDRVGHEFGWMSENQMYSINFADSMIDEVVDALKQGGYFANTLLIVTSDHGGHGFGHGDASPIDTTIPWLAVGPGVPQGVILSTPIKTIDNAATAAYALGLTMPERWSGKPIMEIFPNSAEQPALGAPVAEVHADYSP